MRSGYVRSAALCVLLLCGCSSPTRSAPSRAKTPQTEAGVPPSACTVGVECDAGPESDAATPVATVARGICTATGECEQAIAVRSASHANGPIAYPDPPPVGGDHSPCWGAWGVHDQPLGAEHWVHNLEHGGVVALYHCPAGCAMEVKQLGDWARGRRLALLTEYTALPTRFGVVAWGYRLLSDTLDLRALQAFYDAHVDHAPESIDSPPPSSCP
jgi:hypothetical protein